MLLVLYALSIALMLALPIGAAVLLRRRFLVSWGLFCAGAFTFVASQVVHIPLNELLGRLAILPELPAEGKTLLQAALVLGLTAGLSEELARAVAYGVLRRARRLEDAIMLGLGHGGIEAMLLGAVLSAASLSALWPLRGTNLDTLGLPAEQQAALTQQLQLLTTSPLLAALPLLERILAMTVHVILSLLVWQAFRQRNGAYLLLAIVYHAAVDFVAVYAAIRLDNPLLIEALLAATLLPGLLWLWRIWRQERPVMRRPGTLLSTEITLLGTAVHKELTEQWRSKRVLIVMAVFVLFGLTSPLLARFTPELLRSIEGAEQFADLIPEPTAAEALAQYIENLTQFGFLLVILLGMGAIAGEKERGTAAMLMTKPLPRWAFVISKFIAQAAVYLVAFGAAALGGYIYTVILFGPIPLAPFVLANLLLLLWLLTYAAVTLLGSALGRTTGQAAGLALAGSVFLLLAGSLPRWGTLAPGGLIAWAGQLGSPGSAGAPANGGALVLSLVIVIICLVAAVAAFEAQEL